MPRLRGPWRKTIFTPDPVASVVIARAQRADDREIPGPRLMQPARLYSLFKEGYRLPPDEREILIQHLLEINVCDMRIFRDIRDFEKLQAERGIDRRSS